MCKIDLLLSASLPGPLLAVFLAQALALAAAVQQQAAHATAARAHLGGVAAHSPPYHTVHSRVKRVPEHVSA